jgi:hypothetical protein
VRLCGFGSVVEMGVVDGEWDGGVEWYGGDVAR